MSNSRVFQYFCPSTCTKIRLVQLAFVRDEETTIAIFNLNALLDGVMSLKNERTFSPDFPKSGI